MKGIIAGLAALAVLAGVPATAATAAPAEGYQAYEIKHRYVKKKYRTTWRKQYWADTCPSARRAGGSRWTASSGAAGADAGLATTRPGEHKK